MYAVTTRATLLSIDLERLKIMKKIKKSVWFKILLLNTYLKTMPKLNMLCCTITWYVRVNCMMQRPR